MTSDEKNRKVSYTEDEKKIIMEYCLKTGTKLYEKLSSEVSRKTQSLAWQSIADELTQIEQINVESATKLKQNVTNWIRRATKASDAAKRTGVGTQPKLTEFQKLCLSFVSAAKGATAINYIDTNEPSGTDAPTITIDENSTLAENITLAESIALANEIERFDVDPTFRRPLIDNDNSNNNNNNNNTRSRKRKASAPGKESSDSWKEKYFQSMVNNDEKSQEAGIRKANLKSYNLLLRSISMEKSLGLKEHEIIGLRSSISTQLVNLPSHLTEFVVQDVPPDLALNDDGLIGEN